MSHSAALPFRPQAVIFDMDGLMLDSERAITACLAQAAADQGLQIEPAFWLRMVGTGDAACRRLLGERIGEQPADTMLAYAQRLYAAAVERGIPHRPGIIALLDYLAAQHMPRAVATSTQRPLALRKLEAADLLWRFDAVCTASDVVHPKPAPDIYLLAARTLAVDPAHCLVLEDSPTGVHAALAAGMTPIQIPDLLEPDATVRALGHRILPSLVDAQRLLEARLSG
ncbi:HAD family hydrolase [Xanthomonas cissicola]|uniref:Hydrolase n=1 Tax=Xanthomonas cissicola TaxID=86186 RepID=A0ABX3LY76_9XANT|nr:HAD family phosphatase [Xanthomonas cissicola]KAB0539741.1 HAD family phosphatase [Xanthomonas cissicola]OOW61441.1 hydrolase [Xanthomonas cissicola]